MRSRSLLKATEIQTSRTISVSHLFRPLEEALRRRRRKAFPAKEQPRRDHFEEWIATQMHRVCLGGLFSEKTSKHTEVHEMMQVLQGIVD